MLGYVLKVEAVSDENGSGSADTRKLFKTFLIPLPYDNAKNDLYAQKYIL